MRYEAAAVIRAAEIEIKEYFAIFSEDDALNIMEVVDGAVSAIYVMLGLCDISLKQISPFLLLFHFLWFPQVNDRAHDLNHD